MLLPLGDETILLQTYYGYSSWWAELSHLVHKTFLAQVQSGTLELWFPGALFDPQSSEQAWMVAAAGEGRVAGPGSLQVPSACSILAPDTWFFGTKNQSFNLVISRSRKLVCSGKICPVIVVSLIFQCYYLLCFSGRCLLHSVRHPLKYSELYFSDPPPYRV